MSIQAVAWALDQNLPARPKLVLVSIANHANHNDGYCWLKVDTIASEASCSSRAVFNFIGDLIRNGFVRKAPRRGEDGKQRANDYWILINRVPAEWIKAGKDNDPDSAEVDDDEAQDIGAYPEQNAVGSEVETEAPAPVEIPADACGPTAPVCSHKDSDEPSKIKPEENARARPYTPRSYHPPPPPPAQPVAAVAGVKGQYRFVYDNSRAYQAWAKVKAKETGVSAWHLLTTKIVNGEARRGWYFPTLFPGVPDNVGSDPPKGTLATEEELKQFGKTG